MILKRNYGGLAACGPLTTHLSPLLRHRRSGVTLTETLVAIFVCGLGLMALMTLFPIGALNMAQALKDDRTAHAAANAASILRSVWRVSLENGQIDPVLEQALARPAGQPGQSCPVYLDPIGFWGYPSGGQVGNPPCGIPRVSLQALDNPTPPITRSTAIKRWFTLLDDINFAKTAKPIGEPVQVQRDAKYSWAYMVRRLRDNDPRALEFSVVVYSGRSVGTLDSGSGLLPAGEQTLSGVLQGPKQVTLSYAGARPGLKKGGWIMQAPEGYFYRVVQLTDVGPGALEVEVQTQWRTRNSTFVVMDKVVEVFERSTLE